ncbi:MAG: porin [Flavobacteriales bacterium]|nr:porin [Flavobacteriales bacterium]
MKQIFILLFLVPFYLHSQNDSLTKLPTPKPEKKNWYESIEVRGYVQARYNRLLETNSKLGCEQCDKSWGNNNGFFLRRIRLIFYGQISKQVYFYIQPDFASSVSSTSLNFGQLRDAYFDIGLDKNNVFRFRIGQSKVPYGFENLQSSQNRLPLDRNDALNSAISNERDLGVFFYYTPKSVQSLFKEISKEGLKHSGNYGLFGIGAYNGQTANKPELNNEQHVVARLTYPFKLGSQIIEPGVQAYHGNFVMPASQLSPGVKFKKGANYIDQRAAASLVLYPKPFGIQAEYNVGYGPEYNKHTDSVEVKRLEGGYATLSFKLGIKNHIIIPFTRIQYYSGGKKHETDARSYKVNEYEFGIEWQPGKNFELVAMYTISGRKYEDFIKQNNFQEGQLLRLQAQVNF